MYELPLKVVVIVCFLRGVNTKEEAMFVLANDRCVVYADGIRVAWTYHNKHVVNTSVPDTTRVIVVEALSKNNSNYSMWIDSAIISTSDPSHWKCLSEVRYPLAKLENVTNAYFNESQYHLGQWTSSVRVSQTSIWADGAESNSWIICRGQTACFSAPCQNNGLCRNVGRNFTCGCTQGFTGASCETEMYDHSTMFTTADEVTQSNDHKITISPLYTYQSQGVLISVLVITCVMFLLLTSLALMMFMFLKRLNAFLPEVLQTSAVRDPWPGSGEAEYALYDMGHKQFQSSTRSGTSRTKYHASNEPTASTLNDKPKTCGHSNRNSPSTPESYQPKNLLHTDDEIKLVPKSPTDVLKSGIINAVVHSELLDKPEESVYYNTSNTKKFNKSATIAKVGYENNPIRSNAEDADYYNTRAADGVEQLEMIDNELYNT